MSTPLLIVGSGGFARETAAAVRDDPGGTWDLLGFLDDDPRREGSLVGGILVLGPTAAVTDHPSALVVVCTGNPRDYASRYRIVQRLGLDPERYARIVHPTAAVGSGTSSDRAASSSRRRSRRATSRSVPMWPACRT